MLPLTVYAPGICQIIPCQSGEESDIHVDYFFIPHGKQLDDFDFGKIPNVIVNFRIEYSARFKMLFQQGEYLTVKEARLIVETAAAFAELFIPPQSARGGYFARDGISLSGNQFKGPMRDALWKEIDGRWDPTEHESVFDDVRLSKPQDSTD